jgi:hypothetical protein
MATFEPTENTYIILFTNDTQDAFTNYYIMAPSAEGVRPVVEFPENINRFKTYNSLSAFNAELSILKVGTIATDPFLIPAGCDTLNDVGECPS